MTFPKYFKFCFFFFLLFLITFQSQRIILLGFNWDLISTTSFSEILFSLFNRGLLFDIYISSYFILIPYLILGLLQLLFPKEKYNFLFIIFKIYFISLILFSTTVLISDILYYDYYSIRLTKTVLEWVSGVQSTLGLLFGNFKYTMGLIFGILFMTFIIRNINVPIRRIIKENQTPISLLKRIPFFLITLFLLVLGMRGTYKFNKMPLTKIDAYFSEDPFLNQSSFNPVYTFLDSFNKFNINHFAKTENAIAYASKVLKSNQDHDVSPVYREVKGNSKPKQNVVLLLVESLSKNTLSYHNKSLKTTPFIDSLIDKSIYFDNFFSANTHTHGGIYSSLYAYPLSPQEHALNSVETSSSSFYGLPSFFKEHNYNTTFYVGGRKQFDNMNSFLLNHDFDNVIGGESYSPKTERNVWGVNDDILLNKTIEQADSFYSNSKLFFQPILTTSTHKGVKVKDYINKDLYNKNAPYNMYEGFDKILEDYFESAKSKPWFDNTLFVIIGDHGQVFDPVYDMPLSYHKIPLILYSKSINEAKTISNMGMQIDVFPTIASLFNTQYPNNTFGVDLFKTKREFAYFCSDSKLGVIDEDHFLIYNSTKNMGLFDYQNKSQKDIKTEHKTKVDSMLNYIFSMLQTKDYLITTQKNEIPNRN